MKFTGEINWTFVPLQEIQPIGDRNVALRFETDIFAHIQSLPL